MNFALDNLYFTHYTLNQGVNVSELESSTSQNNSIIITPYMEKGGVGKTTISALLGFSLAALGKVLLIDADPQGNLTHHFLEKSQFLNEKKQLLYYLTKTKTFDETVIEARPPTKSSHGIYIMGTETNSEDLQIYIQGKFNNDPIRIKILTKEARKQGFNFIIFDTPVFFGFYTKKILSISNQVIPIVEPEEFGYDSLFSLVESFEDIKEGYDVSFDHSICIVNKYNKRMAIHKNRLAQLEKLPIESFVVPHSDAIPYASALNIVLHEYKPTNPIISIFDTIAVRLNQIRMERN
jgi:chromosome partitioning protein